MNNVERSLETPGEGGCGAGRGGERCVGERQLDPALFGTTVKATLYKGIITTQIFTNIPHLKQHLQI